MVPRRFGAHLFGHEVHHVVDMGWRHFSNGKLLSLCEGSGFSVFITKDGSLPHQQNLAERQITVIVLKPLSQNFDDLVALAPLVLEAFPNLHPGPLLIFPPKSSKNPSSPG